MTAIRPWLDQSLPSEQRAALVVEAMSLDECIQQLDQTPLKQTTPERLRAGLGSVILAGSATAGNDDGNGFTAEILNDLQRIAVEESRLGIPFITGRDVIHGHLTVFPIPLGQAASWNPDTVRAGCRRRRRRIIRRWCALDFFADDRHFPRPALGADGGKLWRKPIFKCKPWGCRGGGLPRHGSQCAR